MTAFTPRRRHPKLAVAGLAAWAAAATGIAVYAVQTVRIPDRVCVSVAKPHPATQPRPAAGAAPAPAPVSARRSAVSRPGAGQDGTSVPAIDLSKLSWQDYKGIPLPSSRLAGPADTAGGLASGYADSPLGAVLAAVNITARTSWQFGPGVFGPTIARQVTGQFAARLRSQDQDAWNQAAPGAAAGTQGTREVAFSVEQYTPSGATVDVVSGTPGAEAYAVTRVQVTWTRGDWRVVAPPGGDWGNSAAQVSSAAGFTAFPGQGA